MEQATVHIDAERSRADEAATASQFAGGIAHDFNNIVSVIANYADFVAARVTEPDVLEDVEQIRAAADHAAELTRQLLVFFGAAESASQLVDLNQVLARTQARLRHALGDYVRLRIEPGAHLRPVRLGAGQADQILLNLAINAKDAMAESGTLTLATENRGGWVHVMVSDDGVGMSAEVIQRACEPFFTTKGPGRGTGLGLATVCAIVREAGGHLELTSKLGAGTTVHIFLPADQTATGAR